MKNKYVAYIKDHGKRFYYSGSAWVKGEKNAKRFDTPKECRDFIENKKGFRPNKTCENFQIVPSIY